ncbi:hypothetical protein [Niveispirillum sp.]|uniref:hypothetical protein n=1 Tax=Niveispirillum sp. TaxID=1917217 RepID=UPI001B5DC13D|nr:hypothetical protein [Niveispirillum sp.]MBP7335629.1 hypothetical protein [Niveispirillum sp.]
MAIGARLATLLQRWRDTGSSPLAGLIIAERFHAPEPNLGIVRLDLTALPLSADLPLIVTLLRPGNGDIRQVLVAQWTRLGHGSRLALPFPPFQHDAGELFHLFVHQTPQPPSSASLTAAAAAVGLGTRTPIRLPDAPSPAQTVMVDGAVNPQVRVVYGIDNFWCDRHGVFLQGWVHCHEHRVIKAAILIGQDRYDIPTLTPRPDLLNFYPDYAHVTDAGFMAYLESRPGQPVCMELLTEGGLTRVTLELPRAGVLSGPWTEGQVDKVNDFFLALRGFVDEVNAKHLTVAEIGARVVGDASHTRSHYFPKARRFIGIDIHAGPGVDVVGDAHQLDRLVGRGGIDAIFSFSVIEHLSHPWLLAAATNRALSLGGLVFHSAPQTYPMHEQPNDFWRFSDEGLKVLFGPEAGFEVLAAGMVNRMEIYPEDRRGPFSLMPVNPGYGNAFILARKVRDLPDDAIAWPSAASQSQDRAALYPNRTSAAGGQNQAS